MHLKDGILVINFGSQYTQLIARRIREMCVYTEVISSERAQEVLQKVRPRGIILSGGPSSIYERGAPQLPKPIFAMGIPILGICYGMQLIASAFDGKIARGKVKEYGEGTIKFRKNTNVLFSSMPDRTIALLSHGDEVCELPKDFVCVARSTPNNITAAMAHKTKAIFGVQFHPETTHCKDGALLLSNFLFNVCSCPKTWKIKNIMQEAIAGLTQQIGREKVILGLSGGIDSSVAAVLIHKAIGKQLICIFIDTGMLRFQEAQEVLRVYKKKFNLNIQFVQAEHIFLKALQNVSDPEEKRRIIGRTFVEVFEKEAFGINRKEGVHFFAQGTIYPDVIESAAGAQAGGAHTIKSHHNVGGLPKNMKLKVIEPLRNLFKDEVRRLGKLLELPKEILVRHPFPGPGLAVRIIGNITKERITILQKADAIFIDELVRAKLYDKVGQAFAVLLPSVKSVGVMGDKRTYEHVCVLRAVDTIDYMTASCTRLPYELLERVSSRIIGEVEGINRVAYDISSKPPATIEWE